MHHYAEKQSRAKMENRYYIANILRCKKAPQAINESLHERRTSTAWILCLAALHFKRVNIT